MEQAIQVTYFGLWDIVNYYKQSMQELLNKSNSTDLFCEFFDMQHVTFSCF